MAHQTVSLGVAMSVLIAACALVAPGPPPGTRSVEAQVTNASKVAVELAVRTQAGVLTGAVQPTTLPAGGTDKMTFYLPIGGDWWISVNGTDTFARADVDPHVRRGCLVEVEIQSDRHIGNGC